MAHFDAGGEYTKTLAFSHDGRWLANGAGRAVKTWDMRTLKEAASVAGVQSATTGLAFSPDDKLLAYCDWQAIHFWDVPGGKEAFTLPCKQCVPA
jgi:WD40 repeat protein